jgi:predicted NBD/HSP70 family sugar kinase
MVAEAYARGEAWAIPLTEVTLDYLAIAIGAVASVLDPELVVLGGGVMQSLGAFIAPLAQRLAGKLPRVPPIIVSELGSRAAVLGGMISLLPGAADFDSLRQQP